MEENGRQKSSLKNNIMIAFILVIMIWGIALNIAFQFIQEGLLERHGIDSALARDMTGNFVVVSNGITIIVFVIALLVALMVSNKISRPVNVLTRGITEVANGNLDVIIEVESQDELGVLADTFNKMIAERKRIDSELRKSLWEKEILLKEVHHRVKNNMAIISSLLNMQSRKLKSAPMRRAIEDSRDRVMSMALIHEKLYQSGDFQNINVKDYFETLGKKLLQSYGVRSSAVRFEVDIRIDTLGLDALIPCGLIINELVSNSLKYAFHGAGEKKISILLKRKQDVVELVVGDNGIGIPVDFSLEESETLGLEIVGALSKQLKGEISLDRSSGTKFSITFPENIENA